MVYNKGKAWELKFKEDFKKSLPDSTIDRIYDQISNYNKRIEL